MKNGMAVVQWADLTGTGFSPQRRDSDAPAEYWAAAEGLLRTDLSQPPDGIRDTGRHPIWTLRHVQVGRRRTWCFVVQGRLGDGGFGVAGTCRFAFATEDLEAADAWRRGIEATGVRPAEPQMSEARFAAGVREVLRGLIAAQDRIPVGLGPADTARIIACVLGVLPEADARNWSWTTCALVPPGRTKRREVSGAWPEEFRQWEPRRAGTVAASFEEAIASTQDLRQLLDGPRIEGFEEFAGQAVRGKVDADLRRGSRDLAELISRIRRSTRKLGIDDVADMVVSPMGAQELLAEHPKLLTQWAGRRPEDASQLISQVLHPGAFSLILRELLQAQRSDSRNLLGLPTAEQPGPDTWHDRLIDVLTADYPAAELEKHAGVWLRTVWADSADAAAGRPFLLALGLDKDTWPSLYHAQQEKVLYDLNIQKAVTDVVRTELDFEPDPLVLLASLCQNPTLRWLPAVTVVDLIKAADRPNLARRDDGSAALESIATGVTNSWLRSKSMDETEGWLTELVGRVRPDYRLAGHLLAGGLRVLAEHDPEAPRGELLAVSRQVQEQTPLPSDTTAAIAVAERRSRPAHVPAGARATPVPFQTAVQDPPDVTYVPDRDRNRDHDHDRDRNHDRDRLETRRRISPDPKGLLTKLDDRNQKRLKWAGAAVVAAAFVAVPVIALVVLLKPDDRPEIPAPTDPTPVVRETTTPPVVTPKRIARIDLSPARDGENQSDADAREFDRKFAEAQGGREVGAVFILAEAKPDAEERSRRLIEHLDLNQLFDKVERQTVQWNETRDGAKPGVIRVFVVYTS
ncbi:hypothetical protein JIG36_41710 [Actinoplanes sp. LDG1-06]|uniref:Uncharacterized protein n=1 Tax=Paractinoplanes ovalisporus TaxID=2810368 RepID=A0ABS2AQE8_9ACTN|nr:hypothetical protein [Actinoplanes ovalisporus]MBM2622040.1 hypothetical protein [Actinoplanes ovalisporus]